MLFFIIGSSPRTLAISAGVSLLAYCLSLLVDHLRGWTFELIRPITTAVSLLFTILGIGILSVILLALAFAVCRSDPITSLLSHVGRVMSRSLFGPLGGHGAHMHREHKAGQAAVDVLPRLQALPIELWQPVASLSVEELVRRLEAMGALPDPRPLERRELESAYAQAAEPTCAICQEDYEEGDPCRTLWPKCRHAYHVECFDRWALPACQNAPLPVPVLVPASPPWVLELQATSEVADSTSFYPSRRLLRVPTGGIPRVRCAKRRFDFFSVR